MDFFLYRKLFKKLNSRSGQMKNISKGILCLLIFGELLAFGGRTEVLATEKGEEINKDVNADKVNVKNTTNKRKILKKSNKFKVYLKTERGVYYLTWKKDTEAKGYEIQIREHKKASWKYFKTMKGNKYRSYRLVKNGKKYYRVISWKIVDGKKVYQKRYKAKKVNIKKIMLPIKYLCQYPSLPTGCEATALTMVLNFHGFEVSKETMVAKYMEKREIPGDFYNYFIGNPFSKSGLGIYAPGLTKTANSYLKKQNTKLRAYDVTGSSISKICKYVAKGYPVCIWTTYDLDKGPKVTGKWKINGKMYYWKSNEHCMTVIGFNKKRKKLIIANPAKGIREYSMKVIQKRNRQYHKMAVVIY